MTTDFFARLVVVFSFFSLFFIIKKYFYYIQELIKSAGRGLLRLWMTKRGKRKRNHFIVYIIYLLYIIIEYYYL